VADTASLWSARMSLTAVSQPYRTLPSVAQQESYLAGKRGTTTTGPAPQHPASGKLSTTSTTAGRDATVDHSTLA